MNMRFKIETIIKNGYVLCKITDHNTGKEIHCDFDELNNVLYELIEVEL